MSTLVETLGQYVAVQVLKQPKRIVRGDEPLLSSGLIDSFSLVDLALYVEDQFGVHIDDSELNAATFDSLDQLAGLIQQRQA